MGELLFLDGAKRTLHRNLILHRLHVPLSHMSDGAGKEATSPACRVKKELAWPGIDPIHHKGGYSARSVVLASITRALQVVEDLLIDVAEMLALGEIIEVHAVDLV